ncbi:putative colanic acid biosynthesis acetyltransferase [Flavobacterium sp. ANB]|uniref:putative colanic acid biosynthesis acetyltransferase n=1 Tax=unclassified Flavobacterium TaxID=196869 RepID=UPI0012B9AADA|nr:MULTISPECIES: putative colanic acid biosynthesis acetyltransferase [unclassified Flavobacterium]MBF4518055.1 putative colanic acid biosynthesis acetyltransferase [Flavobacterium sp. ANB]MTD71201.1 putative colanic acid biosynthesis acetyltransferase [Flavobacterium sp. LC2016-13]
MEIPKYIDTIPKSDKIYRLGWRLVSLLFFKPFSLPFFNGWRIFLLKLFGAEIGENCNIYASAYIPSPRNLIMGVHSTLGPQVQLHIGKTIIGNKVTISQRTYLCSATHEINSINLPFIAGEIVIKDFVWVAAEAFIMTNTIIGEGSIVGARAVVIKNVEPWTIVAGNPAKTIKERIITK